MSVPHRTRGVKVLKAVSSPIRLTILNLLFDKGALSYTELMNALKMNPSRDAGRFAYHLKFLLKAALLEVDADAKKYYLTELGKMVIDVADRVEKKAHKPRGMIVRTSHYTLEEFDANKIANTLIREAKMPAELAQKTAKEAEKLLLKSKTKYLTAPLVREVVNAILVEKGLEDYRHKLTRLGMPVHEVTALLETKDTVENSEALLREAGKAVLSEYTLLNVYPRDVADAYVSGSIHINNLGTWLLKPNEVIHDLRFFFQNGIQASNPLQLSAARPQTFGAALSTVFNVLLHTRGEVNASQTCDYFNVFLAPFAKGTEAARIKENLRLFITSIHTHVDAALSVDLTIPKFIADKAAIGPQGKNCGNYRDFSEESRLLAELMIDIFAEESSLKPLLNPKLIVKVTDQAFTDENAKALLLKAHGLAAENGAPYFANMLQSGKTAAFAASGCKFETDLTGDWETDTLRTGCIGYVTINLPRIVQESERDKNKFSEVLRERCEMASRALVIKYRALKQNGRKSFPFLTQNTNGDTYFRLESCSSIINLAGLNECVESFTGKSLSNEESAMATEEILQGLQAFKHKVGRKYGKRLFTAILRSLDASERLAQLDVEKYGVAKVKFSGTREKPFYSTTRRIQLQGSSLPSGALDTEQKLRVLNSGGSLNIIELDEKHYVPEELYNVTKQVVEKQAVEFFTYNRKITHCSNCRKNWFGVLHKCPSCGSLSTIVQFDRFSST
ncbi:MAG: ArsR family transcriptional regulator [Candidatus Bathyarchaeota archaeon]|nr:ArsR family transcriptional regulator [Candidatus Bathyarchaeota archaeon]